MLPHGRVAGELPDRIAALATGPIYTYLLSFAVIGVFWLRHHTLFDRLRGSNTPFAVRKLAFLAFVALLPFPTDLLGRYGDQALSVAIYAGNIVVLSVLMGRLRTAAQRMELIAHDAEADRYGAVRGWSVTAVFAVSIPLAFASPLAAKLAWIAVAVVPRLAHGAARHVGAGRAGVT